MQYNTSSAGIENELKKDARFATHANLSTAANQMAAGNTAGAAASLGVSPTDQIIVDLQNKVTESQKAVSNIGDIIKERTKQIAQKEDQMVQGFLDDAAKVSAANRTARHAAMTKELDNIRDFMEKGELEKAQRLANSVFMMGKADPLTITQEEMKKKLEARRDSLRRIP